MTRGRILLVDDDQALCDALTEALVRRGYTVEASTSATDALARLSAAPDVVVADINLGRVSGLQLCARSLEIAPDVPVVLITGFGSMDTAIAGLRAGAWDFITKPVDADSLAAALDRAVAVRGLRAEVRRLRAAQTTHGEALTLIGTSAPMERLRDLIGRVAGTDVNVLVTGESGSGKELVARAVHARSPRADGPFIAINCAALPEALLESELFGHARGAFTDARTARTGLFFQANRGTLFLDEVGELPLSLQPKLLRALQERSARPVGGDREVPFDARIVVATNRDLESEASAGRFRSDLYFRLNVVELPVPPLRSRGTDILLLAQHFVRTSAVRFGKEVRGLTPEVADRLLRHDWPGNVRELANAMERAVALTRFEDLTVDDLPERVRASRPSAVLALEDDADIVPLAQVERQYIRRALSVVGGNKAAAARLLGIDRTTLYRKLEDPDG